MPSAVAMSVSAQHHGDIGLLRGLCCCGRMVLVVVVTVKSSCPAARAASGTDTTGGDATRQPSQLCAQTYVSPGT